jgi:hypothetical protein
MHTVIVATPIHRCAGVNPESYAVTHEEFGRSGMMIKLHIAPVSAAIACMGGRSWTPIARRGWCMRSVCR